MMAYLLARNPFVVQVIAVDMKFELFLRAWCVAELAIAKRSNMQQHMKIHSNEVLQEKYHILKHLDIRSCNASRPEDKQEILEKIEDIAEFNEELQWLIFGSGGLLSKWVSGDKQLHMVARVVARALNTPRSSPGSVA